MYILILVVHIIVSFVLVAVILLQAGRGGGLAETFGGGGGSQMTIFGQKATTFLTKATTASAVLFLCTSLSLAVLSSKRQKSLMENLKVVGPARSPLAGIDTDVTETAERILDEGQKAETAAEDAGVDSEAGKETAVEEKVFPATEEEPPLTR